MEMADAFRQKRGAGRSYGANGQSSARTGIEVLQFDGCGIEQFDDLTGAVLEQTTGFGQFDLPGAAFDQLHAQFALNQF